MPIDVKTLTARVTAYVCCCKNMCSNSFHSFHVSIHALPSYKTPVSSWLKYEAHIVCMAEVHFIMSCFKNNQREKNRMGAVVAIRIFCQYFFHIFFRVILLIDLCLACFSFTFEDCKIKKNTMYQVPISTQSASFM